MRTVLLVRHADIDLPRPPGDDDPGLNAAGEARAAVLARSVAAAGVELLLTSSFRRTQETAAPLARAIALVPEIATTAEAALGRLEAAPTSTTALIVGHSNTVRDIIRGLGLETSVPTITEAEFDNLFVVVAAETGNVVLLNLKYGN